jgi:signal transduction histidine kinase/CheY-like chemotaxis protein
MGMSQTDDFAHERRARLAAERLLESKQAELFKANQKLERHARSLSNEIIVKREETEVLRGRNDQVLEDLERANQAVTIAERRLWDSVQTIDDGFAVFDQKDVMIAANGAYLGLFEDLEMVKMGISYEEVVHLMVDEGLVDIGKFSRREWIDMALTRWYGQVIEPVTIRLWNGTYIKCIDRRSRDGDMVSLALDITDTIKYESELKEARNKAEAANRAKSAFLANMSHELRTPMNGVVGMAELLTEGILDEEQRLYVNTIKSSGEALLGLINDVLDYSKIEAEKLILHSAEFDLERCIHEVVILLQPAAHEKGVDLIIDFDMFLPAKFIGDSGRLRQILINLIGNAVKFTDKGHVLIRAVGLPQGDGIEERVHVSVEDTGIGIRPDMIEHVFGSFNQVEDERNRKFEGTGLGLAITKELVVLMGGEIWAESEYGQGSCFGFHITMPVAEPANERTITVPSWIHRAVLIDHQEAHRSIVEKQLRRLGLEVAEFDSHDALRQAWPAPGDIYLIDQSLPGVDIDALVQDIRAVQGETPILLMTAGPVSASKLSLQGTKMLQKPLLRRDLTQTLSDLEAPKQNPISIPAQAEPAPLIEIVEMPQTPAPVGEPEAAPVVEPEASSVVEPEASSVVEPEASSVVEPEADLPAPVDLAPLETPSPDAPVETVEAEAPVPPQIEATLAVEEPEELPQAAPEIPAPLEARKMRILAAEDNKTNQLVFRKMVKTLDIELTFASNGREAIELYQSFSPDLIFMDISMPEVDGKEATRQIRALEAQSGGHIPIVALTAHAMAGDDQEILAAGLDHYLTKPLRKAAIIGRIEEEAPQGCAPVQPPLVETAPSEPAAPAPLSQAAPTPTLEALPSAPLPPTAPVETPTEISPIKAPHTASPEETSPIPVSEEPVKAPGPLDPMDAPEILPETTWENPLGDQLLPKPPEKDGQSAHS